MKAVILIASIVVVVSQSAAADDCFRSRQNTPTVVAENADATIRLCGQYIREMENAFKLKRFSAALQEQIKLAYILIGVAYDLTDRTQAAIEHFSAAIKKYKGTPLAPAFLNARGNTYLRTGEYIKAIEDFSIAIKLDSKEPLYYQNRARAHSANGYAVEAEEDLNKAKRLK